MCQSLVKLSRGESVVVGPVSGFVFNVIVGTEPPQALGVQVPMDLPGNFQRVYAHFLERHVVHSSAGLHKAVVKRNIMPYQNVVLAEIQKIRDHGLSRTGVRDHLIGDPGQVCD